MEFNKTDEKYFIDILLELGFSLSNEQVANFARFMRELLIWNSKFNLTAITDKKDILIKHFYDSALGLKAWHWTGRENVLDLGSGAGFPGIPLKILSPSIKLVLADSLQKRVGFLQHIIETLHLKQVEAIHGRAEELGQNKFFREKYDIVVSRAVARLSVLAEYCLPFVKQGGSFLAYKGAEGIEESMLAESAINELGGKLIKIESFVLPEELSKRTIVIIQKTKPTPSIYPRRPGIPAKKPLK